MRFSEFDQQCMSLALAEAQKGLGFTYPNPCVGAVVARSGRILSSGYHKRAGSDHAEIVAFRKLGWPRNFLKLRGSTLYVTLEPCAFFGRTPPCVSAILDAKISCVVFGIRDPHNSRKGGIFKMRKAGIQVESGLLEDKIRIALQFFLKNVKKKMPYITAKVGMTLDGKIATTSGDSRGISSKESLRRVHLLRSQNQAILVGVGTILVDNPHLGVRYVSGADPLRVILDSHLRSPLFSEVFRDSNVFVFTTDHAPSSRMKQFEKKRIRFISLGDEIIPQKVLQFLYSQGICTVLVEGGAHILTSFWENGCIDRYMTSIAPKLCGGEKAFTPLLGRGISKVSDLDMLKHVSTSKTGPDFLIDGYLNLY